MVNVFLSDSEQFFRTQMRAIGFLGERPGQSREEIDSQKLSVVKTFQSQGSQVTIYCAEPTALDMEPAEVTRDLVYIAEIIFQEGGRGGSYDIGLYLYQKEPKPRDIRRTQNLLKFREDIQVGALPTEIKCEDCNQVVHWLEVPRHEDNAAIDTRRDYLEREECGCQTNEISSPTPPNTYSTS